MTKHHTGGVYSQSRYGPKPFASKNEGCHWGCEWEVIDEEKVTDRRGKTRKIRRVTPVRAKNSRYMPHQGGGMRSQT